MRQLTGDGLARRPEPVMSNHSMSVKTRPICADDDAFLLRVYASTRSEEMALVPWTEAQREAFLKMQFTAQHQHYQSRYANARFEIILLDETPVGRLYVDRAEPEINILDITLLPEYRHRGIGTPMIKALMAEGQAARRAVRIYVDNFSPALRLFERLGFSRIGEYGYSYHMEWRPDREA